MLTSIKKALPFHGGRALEKSKVVKEEKMGVGRNREMAMWRISLSIIVALAALVGGNFTSANAKSERGLRLVLQITIDGLRADLCEMGTFVQKVLYK